MTFTISVLLLAISATLCGCGFVHDERITGKYRLIAGGGEPFRKTQ